MQAQTSLDGSHVLFLSWRDTANPEGGGAELYLEQIARGLVERGARVTIFCAAHGAAPGDEVRDGIRFVRRGAKMSVYAHGFLRLLLRRFGKVDAVVDVQNGLPFFSRLATRKPVVVLVHHVHREQWPVVYPGLVGKVGWWIESWLSPRLYRHCQYVAVSQATRRELWALRVSRRRIAVVHNGTAPTPPLDIPKTSEPSICVVGRLVPHKQVEHAIDTWTALRDELPGLRLTIAGGGWWDGELHAYAAQQPGGADGIDFTGHVSEERKQKIYAESWVMALPSLKEGWGLVVGEAGMHDTPTVAYRSAGGTRESIADGVSGLLTDTEDEFIAAVREVLTDSDVRARLSSGAREMSHRFTWEHAHGSFAQVLVAAIQGTFVNTQDPEEDETVRSGS